MTDFISPGREFLRRGNPRAYHVHLTAIDSAFWRDHLAFRDRLRSDNALRDAYAALKHDLAARFPRDREAYIEGKGTFVKDVIGRP
ncbi:MAG TPA: GrpB family protein [Gemmatimonadaceae bacterium]